MRDFSTRTIAAVVGVIATCGLGIGSAAAADIPVREAPPPQYGESQDYYGAPPIEERYVYRRPPAVYGYPAPPPGSYYEYGPPTVVVLPPPYYLRRPYAYGGPPYAVRGYAPYVARDYGRYAGRWSRGYHRW